MIKKWIEELIEISNIYNIRLEFVKKPTNEDPGGLSTPNKITLFLHSHLKTFKSGLFSIYFHEWAHIQCYRNGKYKVYHTLKNVYTEREKYIIKYTGLRAERLCDKIASIEMKKMYPKLTYQFSYNTKEGELWYRTWRDKYFI